MYHSPENLATRGSHRLRCGLDVKEKRATFCGREVKLTQAAVNWMSQRLSPPKRPPAVYSNHGSSAVAMDEQFRMRVDRLRNGWEDFGLVMRRYHRALLSASSWHFPLECTPINNGWGNHGVYVRF